MGVVVLQPRDCLTDPFSRNNLTPPHWQKKQTPNRRHRSPQRRQPPPHVSSFMGSKKKNLNHNNIISKHVRILKRGEEIRKKMPDQQTTRQIGSDPVMIPSQIRASGHKTMPTFFYAGTVTSTSPPASEVPLPAFFAKKTVTVFKHADATNDLIRILHLDID
ncbi:hypothetical protein N665_0965s0011 [Sinapis alba]|nr:hypothetical protein N665_0965s0011 [Sinapis alba]